MKVPSLSLQIYYIAIYKDGVEKEVFITSETGCWETCSYLEKHFGIKTVPSTVYNGKKRFEATKFHYNEDKEDLLGYLNWALNFPPSERGKFYNNEPDKSKFISNNPIIDFRIVTKRRVASLLEQKQII